MLLFSALEINSPDTFGGIARSILNQIIMRYRGNVIHFVADKWLTPLIKDIEHRSRFCVDNV